MHNTQSAKPHTKSWKQMRAKFGRALGLQGTAADRRSSVLRLLVLTALAGCLVVLVFSWLGHRTFRDSAQAVAGLDRMAARIIRLQNLPQVGVQSPQESLDAPLQSVREDLSIVISESGYSKAVQGILVRSDTLLTQVQRSLDRPASPGHETPADHEKTTALLGEAASLMIEAAREIQSELDRRLTLARRGILVAFLLAGLALGATAFIHAQWIRSRTRNGLVPDSAAFPVLLAAAVRSTDEGVLITDTGMQIGEPMILFANDSFKNMSGFPDRKLVGQPLRLLRTTCLREKEFSLLEHSYSDSRSTTMETIRWREDGSKVYCEWHISPVREADGKVTHYISILMDVTRLREQEEAQRRSKEELMVAHQRLVENQQQLIHSEKMAFLGQLAAGVAHEINNPVGYVMSNLETLADDIREIQINAAGRSSAAEDPTSPQLTPFFAETQEILHESINGLERVKDIVQRLKNFARPAEAEIRKADINHEIEVALKIVNNELHDKCTVRKELGDLPTIECRPGQLNQVFANLFANAAQAIARHGAITITTEFTGSEILVKVTDDGVGIEQENISRVFAPFFTTKPTGKGTGLGLSVSYGIIQKHNGTIEVESTVGKGSTFTVHLPVPAKDQT
ncbi:MAG: PAS domain S-box protein [Thermoanaerobaculales bacterium]|nr:PAS domain S-box protein [Thermoanaerobaculales bacterium]